MKKAAKKGEVKKRGSSKNQNAPNFKKTILGGGWDYPPGFDKDGRRVIAECPEFKLVELYRVGGKVVVETSKEVERAEVKARLRINTSFEKGDTEERIKWATALMNLHFFTTDSEPRRGCRTAVEALAETLGEEVDRALKSNDPEAAAEKAAKKFSNAILALARRAGKIADRRAGRQISPVVILIQSAQMLFQHHQRRPTKSEVRELTENTGFHVKGKDIKKRWEERFRAAGLDKLPP